MSGDIFGWREDVPQDVVPQHGLTREVILRQNDAVGKPGTGSMPGELLEDADGFPAGVEPDRTVTSIFGGAVITTADLERAGLTRADVPRLIVMDPPGGAA